MRVFFTWCVCIVSLGVQEDVSVESIASRRTRREKKKRASTTALEKIKYSTCTCIVSAPYCNPLSPCRRGRETGVYADDEVEQEESLFEYVDDREYARIVQRRQEEGFVLDDGELMKGAM